MGTDKVYNSIEEVLDIAESAEGKTVGELDINNGLDSRGNKGGMVKVLKKA